MDLRNLALALALLVTFGASARASLNFDFTIVGDPSLGFTSNPSGGTLTGVIYGLTDNSTSTPSEIDITSVPAGFGISASLSSPYILNSGSGWNLSGGSGFVLSGGVISSGTDYFASGPSGSDFDFNYAFGLNGLYEPPPGPNASLLNTGGLGGTSFAPAPTPEPSTYAMMLGGLALLGFCVRRKTILLS